MDKIKRYIDCYIPVTTCTLRCPYCYITQHRLFEGPLPKFEYSPQHVRKALSKERLGGTCLINFCADGETLLAPEIVSYIREILEEGHYVMIVTNATVSKRFDEIADLPAELTRHIFFKFSYHYLEFKEKNLFDKVFSNIRKVRNAGCSFTLELTPSDEAIPYIEDIKAQAIRELGAVNHVTIARDEKDLAAELPMMTNLPLEKYTDIWGSFQSKLFEYKLTIFGHKRKEFCYAGDWSFILNLANGDMHQCYHGWYHQNIFKNIDKPIRFRAIGCHCREHHCYNGHSYIVLGDIPELKAPTYAELRNRVCEDGSEWLNKEVKELMSSKLWESNIEYSALKKIYINLSTLPRIFCYKLKCKYKGWMFHLRHS